jgi:cytochrome c553
MGEALAKLANARKSDRPKKDNLSSEDAAELAKLQKEAKRANAYLASGGKGGLDPHLAHAVFKRDKYRCKQCGTRGRSHNGLTLHHRGGIVSSERMSRAAHKNTESNIVTLCESCHSKDHDKARAEGIDSSQVLPKGDKGTKRDHGDLPVAKG